MESTISIFTFKHYSWKFFINFSNPFEVRRLKSLGKKLPLKSFCEVK